FALPSPCPTSSQLSTLSLHDALPICYDPIEVGVSDPGGTIVTPLPDSWVTGLAEGSLRGLFAWPGETQQYVVLGDHNTYQWYTSPISGNSYWRGTPVTDDCLAL